MSELISPLRAELTVPRIYRYGERAVTIEAGGTPTLPMQQRVWQLAAAFSDHPAVTEIVPGMNNLTLLIDTEQAEPDKIAEDLLTHWAHTGAAACAGEGRTLSVPVRYGGTEGPDLEIAAAHAGLTCRELIERHSAVLYQVYFLGFLPGFAYLGDLDPRIVMPRRAEPRVSVPAGSVAIGGQQTGIYPAVSPGGWHIIGRTDLALFTPEHDPPVLVHPGDAVRFVPMDCF